MRWTDAKKRALTDHAIGVGLAFAYVTWLLATARSLGFGRDEGFYFRAATDYARWFAVLFETPARAFEQGTIDASWSDNHEHPALMKSLFALSWMFLHERLKVFSDASTAFRLPGMAMAGVSLWVTYLFGTRAYCRRAGIAAAVLLGLMPNVFFHAHLACFDVPIMAMWTLCIYVYWRSHVEGGLLWAVASGVVYGLTLETKHNAWFLPAVFILHALVANARDMARGVRRGLLPVPTSLIAMATIGPLVFYALWPWIWNDTIDRVRWYVNFHLNHEYYNIEFLHKNYWGPPSPKAYAPVMIAATVPLVTLTLFAIGAFERLKNLGARAVAAVAARLESLVSRGRVARALGSAARLSSQSDPNETDVLIMLGFAIPLAPFFLSKTPIFGGTKHWLPSYPMLALLAGVGFDRIAGALKRALPTTLAPYKARLAVAALFASVTIGPLAVTAHSHPFGLSAYTPLVGGTAGGADLGLCRQFWGFTTQSLAPYLERAAPPHASLYLHDTTWDSWQRLVDEKRVRPDIRGAGSPAEADLCMVQHELHMEEVELACWVTDGHDNPDYVLTHDGVPIISVFRR
jgi:4-amino-4-deoxy-L-arabinose transferase-like glycosyltransferase